MEKLRPVIEAIRNDVGLEVYCYTLVDSKGVPVRGPIGGEDDQGYSETELREVLTVTLGIDDTVVDDMIQNAKSGFRPSTSGGTS